MTKNRSMKKSGRPPGNQPGKRPLTETDSCQATVTITDTGPHHQAASMHIIRADWRHVTEAAS